MDSVTQTPIAGARISVQASEQETLADAMGNFELPNASGSGVVVAAAKGFFNGGMPFSAPASGLTLALDAIPTVDDPNYQFPSPQACSNCHPKQLGEWAASPMGKAGSNTWVYDTYNGTGTPGGMGGFVYTRDSVHAASNPASECAACHQPEAWISDLYSPLRPIDSPGSEALHGVSCVVCHRIADIDESKPSFPGIWPGVVTFRKTFSAAPVMFGVLGDVDYTFPGVMRASYQPQLPSAVCAACHQDKNDPDLDGDFEEENGVISEPTYIEWLQSPYADPSSGHYATCAGCHMPADNSKAACIVLPTMNRPPGDIRAHEIQGTSAPYLENAASLALSASAGEGSVAVDVTVANDKTGHHVPTGVTIRNMILVVEALRADTGEALEHTGSQKIHELGGVGDAAKGYWAGLPGKLYAKVNHDAQGNGPTFFTDAVGITFDTRIPALQSDMTHYTFAAPVGEKSGKIRVRARLIYRRAWRSLVDAKGWTKDGHNNTLEDLVPPNFGHLMAQAETLVEVQAPAGQGGGGQGGAGQGGESGNEKPQLWASGGGGCQNAAGQRNTGWLIPITLLLLGLGRRTVAKGL